MGFLEGGKFYEMQLLNKWILEDTTQGKKKSQPMFIERIWPLDESPFQLLLQKGGEREREREEVLTQSTLTF